MFRWLCFPKPNLNELYMTDDLTFSWNCHIHAKEPYTKNSSKLLIRWIGLLLCDGKLLSTPSVKWCGTIDIIKTLTCLIIVIIQYPQCPMTRHDWLERGTTDLRLGLLGYCIIVCETNHRFWPVFIAHHMCVCTYYSK